MSATERPARPARRPPVDVARSAPHTSNGLPGALLDAAAAAELLNVPRTWVLAEARADRIPHVRLGRYVRFEADELAAWWQARRRGPWRARGAAAASARAGNGPAPDREETA